ncbi:biliverdin-producing heme oxygenase [Thiohalophilus thiocyanatoxydans]|uniref:biliverdin-producing heme oxygenase n=1 Tax=Thiohalophilus thiocyanatoxydans TaxID=381308 RepID=UPI001417069A|nr:biliverdin-producing heme oxygenase [Thiohalophilus thiocyanatoxydans]
MISQLRTATKPVHQSLEQHPILQPLLSPVLTREDYRRVLIAFADFYRILEPPLLDELIRVTDQQNTTYHYRPRWPLLQDDLRDLGTMIDTLPSVTPALPSMENTGALLGVLYVLEGATQGGRIIAPHLARTLGLDADCGVRYFRVYQQDTWQQFKALLTCYDGLLDDKAVTHSAVQIFNMLYQHLDHYLPSDRTDP